MPIDTIGSGRIGGVGAEPFSQGGSIMVSRQKYHERVVAPVADPLAAVVRLAAAHDNSDYVCYESPEGWAFASGIVAEVTADRHQIVFRTREGEKSTPWDSQTLRQLPRILDDAPVESWRIYGWAGFDLAAANAGQLDLVGNDVFLRLVIPDTEVRFRASGTLLRALDPADLDGLQAVLEAPGTVNYRAQPVIVDSSLDTRYVAAVSQAIAEIRSNRFEKVILSRTVPIDHPVDLVGTYLIGRRAGSPARSFLFSLHGLGAAGFSPETVVEVTGDGVVTTQPLAGTRARTGLPGVDRALQGFLLRDPKEIFEHAISFRAAYNELATLCGDSPIEVPDFMSVRERGTVQHLASSIRARLPEQRRAWDAFAALFPAVTVSGIPKQATYSAIRELETGGRGPYGGAVLTYDHDGAMDAAVVLRTVFTQGGRSWLRAGAGIVAQSRPEREFTETCEKLSSVARYIVPKT